MPTVDEMKQDVAEAIDRGAETAIGAARTILESPETGFRELKASKLVQDALRALGIEFQSGIAVTGVKATLDGGAPGPTVAVLGELDSVVCSGHPHADPETGAAHACGHHAQIGMLVAVAHGLSGSGVMEHLAGRAALMAVPAEEYIEIAYRLQLKAEGKIELLGGKPEMVRVGAFDDVDMAMMTHTTTEPDIGLLGVGATFNGMIAKEVEFLGKAAHAGACPWNGINALNAASVALAAINANRETFREEDAVRIHPIITQGGELVNIVPARARMEMYVRGKSIEAMQVACEKVDRCLRAGAMAVGAKVKIATLSGYLPTVRHDALSGVYRVNAQAVVGAENVGQIGHRTASTDMSDLTQIMPAIHPYAGGTIGIVHGDDYLVEDWKAAAIAPAKAMAFTVIDLLADGAKRGKQVKAECKPKLSKEQYLEVVRSFFKEELYVATE